MRDQMNISIEVKQKGPVFEAVAYDASGNELDRLVAFTASNARRLLKHKLGLKVNKKKKTQEMKHISTLLDSKSIMRGLEGITSSRNWKKVK